MRDGQGASEVALAGLQAGGVLQLAGRVLEPEAEEVTSDRLDVLDELGVVEITDLLGVHQASSSAVTILVRTGNFVPARRRASRARGSGTPASSNMTRPGFTTATQPSGEPLPEPMRVSAGFCVTGFSRETVVPTLPPPPVFRGMGVTAGPDLPVLAPPG